MKSNFLRLDFILASVAFFVIFEFIFFYKIIQIINIEHLFWVKFYVILSSFFLLSRPILAMFYEDNHNESESIFKKNQKFPSVSFVISAKNEEDSIYKCVNSCVSSKYNGKIECIVVNDGSTDNTLSEMLRAKKDFTSKKICIEVINFEKNQGKREGMYAGMMHSRGEILVFVDSDSFLNKDSLNHIVFHFLKDKDVGAVSGNTLVENRDKFITKMQSAKYAISFDILKSCESIFGAVSCCPGCFSAYRTSVVLPIAKDWKDRVVLGTKASFGDDRSLTNFVLKTGWNVKYCRKATATTIVPDTYKKLIKQQLRWKKSWIREGLLGAAGFMWKKHPIAFLSFYINLLIPFFAPFIVSFWLLVNVQNGQVLNFILFLISLSLMSLAYGLFTYIFTKNKDYLYSIPFSIFYSIILSWQMIWAILNMKDTRWGTR